MQVFATTTMAISSAYPIIVVVFGLFSLNMPSYMTLHRSGPRTVPRGTPLVMLYSLGGLTSIVLELSIGKVAANYTDKVARCVHAL